MTIEIGIVLMLFGITMLLFLCANSAVRIVPYPHDPVYEKMRLELLDTIMMAAIADARRREKDDGGANDHD